MANKVRTRFAPSPTGYLHVGGVRTALFAWLVAKQADGEFILRIEDTDRSRHIEESEKHIVDTLDWLGINSDGKIVRQSERLDIYQEWANKLVASGRAYADTRTPEELEAIRSQAIKEKRPVLFREHRPKNSSEWIVGMSLRFKSDPKAYSWQDAVMGELTTGPEVVDDFIIIKSDGFPTYNFAHIVDDDLMKISHVIRSQEFLASVPKYLNLYEALGVKPPILATLPYVMAPSGNKKLSKRDGAKDILDYAREGYLPEAMLNFIATLGWNDGTEQELFSIGELIEKFDLSRVQKSGAMFDERRLLWLDGAHIRSLNLNELYKKTEGFWPAEAEKYDKAYKKSVLGLVQERLKYFAELSELTKFFFVDLPIDKKLINQHKQLKKLSSQEQIILLEQGRQLLDSSTFNADTLTNELNSLLEKTNQKPAVLFSLIRIATTGSPASPGLVDTLLVLGKNKSLARIDSWLKAL